MDIVTLGMLIIDEIHFQDSRPPAVNTLGGAGSWAVIGARMFRSAPTSRRIGWTVHRGSDFPPSIEQEINTWNTSCNFVDTPFRLTTRGWNKYGNDEERAFKYTTEKLRVDETHLTREMLLSRCFHLICTPTRCVDLVKGILLKRYSLTGAHEIKEPPLFVWEPVPDSCGPDELVNLMEALKYVDVISPNHQELAALLRTGSGSSDDHLNLHETVQASSAKLLAGFNKAKGAVVVRCGEQGCYVASSGFNGFLPAYHQKEASAESKVVDPTGAGNAFLGAFCIGILDSHSKAADPYHWGAIYGAVAAGCAIEQIGLPKLELKENKEFWNDISLEHRWKEYEKLLSRSVS